MHFRRTGVCPQLSRTCGNCQALIRQFDGGVRSILCASYLTVVRDTGLAGKASIVGLGDSHVSDLLCNTLSSLSLHCACLTHTNIGSEDEHVASGTCLVEDAMGSSLSCWSPQSRPVT